MHQLNRIAPATVGQALDQYYTKPYVVRQCLAQLGDLSRFDFVIEPSAGNGAFLNEIEHSDKVGIDIDPQHQDIVKTDWLQYEVDSLFDNVLVVGNPPYGRYHKMSSAFISRAMSFHNVQTVAFILPNVYRKHTRQRIIPNHWRIVSITDLGRDSFTLDGQDHHVPTSFFVFDKSQGPDLRVKHPAKITGTQDFDFSTHADFDIFVFGASPKKVIFNPTSNNRGYYLKAKIPIQTLVEKIKNVEWSGSSCANGGVYWLTKHEFVEQYKACYEQQ